jgi:hypothetical protein
MRPILFTVDTVKKLLEREKVCTLEELMAALGTRSRMTAFRKLGEVPYQTSYSHRGKYYVLKGLCKFDESGLWTHRKAWFSIYGTLLETGRNFVDRSDGGYSNAELDGLLHVETKQALLHLFGKGVVSREKVGGVYVYFSSKEQTRKRQVAARSQMRAGASGAFDDDLLAHELKAAIILFFGLLDERQRRIFAGLESMKIGEGGDARVARALGIDPHTVARGRIELATRDVDSDVVRRKGGGRPPQEKKHQK